MSPTLSDTPDPMSTPPDRLPSTPELPVVHGSGNVFADLGFDPEEAANLQLRSRLAIELGRYVEAEGITQAEAAARFGVSQPRVSDLVRGKLDRFTIDALVNMLARVGRQVEVSVGPGPASRAAA